MTAPVICPRCKADVRWQVNPAVSLTWHYDEAHPDVEFLRQCQEIVQACSP